MTLIFQSDQDDYLQDLIVQLMNHDKLNNLIINDPRFKLFDFTVFNEFTDIPQIDHISLKLFDMADMKIPAITNQSVISQIFSLSVSQQISIQSLNQLIGRNLKALTLNYFNISIELLNGISELDLTFVNFQNSLIQSVPAVIKSLCKTETLIVSNISYFDVILLATVFKTLIVDQILGNFDKGQYFSATSAIDSYIQQLGYDSVLYSNNYISLNKLFLADFIVPNMNIASVCYDTSLINNELIHFKLPEKIINQFQLIFNKQEPKFECKTLGIIGIRLTEFMEYQKQFNLLCQLDNLCCTLSMNLDLDFHEVNLIGTVEDQEKVGNFSGKIMQFRENGNIQFEDFKRKIVKRNALE